MTKNKSSTRTVRPGKYVALLLLGGGLLLFVVAGWLWWTRVYATPERVFLGMLDNSLSTSSVTRQVGQESQGSSLEQYIELSFGAQNRSHIVSTLAQSSGADATKVTTESIGTTDTDFTRYTAIETNQTNNDDQPLDFSELIGVWGKSGEAESEQGSARYFNEALLGVVPFANLSPAERQALLQMMQDNKVFETDYAKATRRQENGRSVYVYDVTIRPQVYVAMLQAFTKAVGLESVQGLEQDQYEGVPPLEVQLSVDTVSRQLTSIRYAATGRQETYSGHGLRQYISLPEQTVPIQELQNRLQAIR